MIGVIDCACIPAVDDAEVVPHNDTNVIDDDGPIYPIDCEPVPGGYNARAIKD